MPEFDSPFADAIFEDTSDLAFLAAEDGTISRCNFRHAEFGIPTPPRSLADLSPVAALVEEHAATLSCARDCGRAARIRGFLRGRFTCATYRWLDDLQLALGTVRAVPEDEPPRGASDHTRRASVDDLGPLSHLTEREREVLSFVGRGLTSAAIAEHLDRSAKTIEWHRAALGNKLHAPNRVELARIAIHYGLARGLSVDDTPVE